MRISGIAVEAWAPDHGGEVDIGEALDESRENVHTTCEMQAWDTIAPTSAGPWDASPVAFVDGTRRIDARVFAITEEGPVPGVAGSVGVGAVVCDGRGNGGTPSAAIERIDVDRVLALGAGLRASLAVEPGLDYRGLPVPGRSVDSLVGEVHNRMRAGEAALAQELAGDGRLVFLDGPLAVMRAEPRPVVGFIKGHHARYLEAAEESVLVRLGCGERTPVFAFGDPRPRYSWYVRICDREPRMHDWHGLVRCETPASLPLDEVRCLADASALVLPVFASKPHWDARAPQNLVPVAGLERQMRHLLGERDLVYRKIRSAANRVEGAVAGV